MYFCVFLNIFNSGLRMVKRAVAQIQMNTSPGLKRSLFNRESQLEVLCSPSLHRPNMGVYTSPKVYKLIVVDAHFRCVSPESAVGLTR